MKKLLPFLFLTISSTIFFASPALAASSKEQTAISVYNKEYYGTITDNSDGTSTFTTIDSPDILSITGQWEDDSFAGDCTITYSDDSYQKVTYKKGSINGIVQQIYSDGTSKKFLCKNGTPYLYIKSYSSDGLLTDIDWYYLSVPIQTFVSNAITPEYSALSDDPNTYVDRPIAVTGTVTGIYESVNERFIKLTDKKKNIYVFKYQNTNTYKYRTADICTLETGQEVTLYGIFYSIWEIEKTTSLFDSVPGYAVNFNKISQDIVTDDFVYSSQSLFAVKDSDFSDPLPLLTAIYCDRVLPRPDLEELNYTDICDQPLYFYKNRFSLSGTVVHMTDSQLFIKKALTSDIYVTDIEDLKTSDFKVGDSISCTATFDGTAKVPYYNSETKDFMYILYPNIKISKLKLN